MANTKEIKIVIVKESEQEAIKLLELLNGFDEKELSALLMFVQGAKFSKQLYLKPDNYTYDTKASSVV